MFCETANPVTRWRVGNSSWKKLAKVAFHTWYSTPNIRMARRIVTRCSSG